MNSEDIVIIKALEIYAILLVKQDELNVKSKLVMNQLSNTLFSYYHMKQLGYDSVVRAYNNEDQVNERLHGED